MSWDGWVKVQQMWVDDWWLGFEGEVGRCVWVADRCLNFEEEEGRGEWVEDR